MFIGSFEKQGTADCEGEPATLLYFPETGRVKLTQLSAEGGELIMRCMAPGEIFAAVALFPGGTYPVTAEATERSRVRTGPETP